MAVIKSTFLTLLLLVSSVTAQTVAKGKENHPRLTTYECTLKRGCKPKNSAIVLDSLSHTIYQKDAPQYNCGDWGNAPNATVCPDAATCQKNCMLEPIKDYKEFGVSSKGDKLHLTQFNKDGKLVTPRVYLLEENKKNYEMLKLTGKEFAFTVDMARLPCGMNAALYLSEMEKDGGKKAEKLNKAGAEYGTGYCDAQCFTTPFINGVPNIDGDGSCCNEMDIWEANREANSIAPHPCAKPRLFKCKGVECAWEGDCDKWGCTYNAYKVGNKDFYGFGRKFNVDTSRPFTVVSSYPANPRTGKLERYERLYVQDGKIVHQASINVTPEINESLSQFSGNGVQNWMDEEYCKVAGGTERYLDLGGTVAMGDAMSRGMVLIFSIWWDAGGYMQWLDGSANNAGPCDATEGSPENIVKAEPFPEVTFSQVKWGEIGSTYTVKK